MEGLEVLVVAFYQTKWSRLERALSKALYREAVFSPKSLKLEINISDLRLQRGVKKALAGSSRESGTCTF